uniref:Lzipper-MIP1 domain-containing protein n=1 Tax=Meloidogyne hapla TaxID=6305 RepID=A0A1I8BHX1_MELHA
KIAMAANDITLKEEIKKELKEEFQTKISSIETKLSEVQKQLCQVLEEKGNLKNYKNKKLDISKKSVTIRKKGPKLLFNSDQVFSNDLLSNSRNSCWQSLDKLYWLPQLSIFHALVGIGVLLFRIWHKLNQYPADPKERVHRSRFYIALLA